MNRERWRELQRALHPDDLASVHCFAESLVRVQCALQLIESPHGAVCEPFVFAYDGRRSMSVDGPAVRELAEVMIDDLTGRPSVDQKGLQ